MIIYDLKNKTPKFKELIIIFNEQGQTKVPIFAKLDRISEDENGKKFHWKERDNNAPLTDEVLYWCDYPIFDNKYIEKETLTKEPSN